MSRTEADDDVDDVTSILAPDDDVDDAEKTDDDDVDDVTSFLAPDVVEIKKDAAVIVVLVVFTQDDDVRNDRNSP